MAKQQFTERVIGIIRDIPAGSVTTYGRIAELAGHPRAARQVSRILHSCSKKENLPWHRVVNREGKIVLKRFQGFEEQKMLLESEGVQCNENGKVNLTDYLWLPYFSE